MHLLIRLQRGQAHFKLSIRSHLIVQVLYIKTSHHHSINLEPKWYRHWIRVHGIVQMNQTVESPDDLVCPFKSNTQFVLANLLKAHWLMLYRPRRQVANCIYFCITNLCYFWQDYWFLCNNIHYHSIKSHNIERNQTILCTIVVDTDCLLSEQTERSAILD